MKHIRLVAQAAALAAALAVPLATAAAATGGANGEWHRNNYNVGEELLTCREGTASWTCTYLVPNGTGWFSGRNVSDSWTCPEWFPSTICDNVVAVYHGRAVYVPVGGTSSGPTFLVNEDYVITNIDGQPVLQLYWVDRFVCPWYRTFEQALANDFTCAFAP
jgi:hypothetical protein